MLLRLRLALLVGELLVAWVASLTSLPALIIKVCLLLLVSRLCSLMPLLAALLLLMMIVLLVALRIVLVPVALVRTVLALPISLMLASAGIFAHQFIFDAEDLSGLSVRRRLLESVVVLLPGLSRSLSLLCIRLVLSLKALAK